MEIPISDQRFNNDENSFVLEIINIGYIGKIVWWSINLEFARSILGYWDHNTKAEQSFNCFGIFQLHINVASSLEFNGFFQDARSGIVQFHVPFVDTSVKWNYWFYKERFFQFHRLNVRFYWQRLSNFVYIFWYLLFPVGKNASVHYTGWVLKVWSWKSRPEEALTTKGP